MCVKMLVFHLIHAILLKKAVSPLLQISTRATAICSEDGISLKISPPSVSGMVMVLLQINSSSFHRFRCNSNCIQSLDLSFLNSLLSTTNDQESLIVSANYSHDTTHLFQLLQQYSSQCSVRNHIIIGASRTTHLSLLVTLTTIWASMNQNMNMKSYWGSHEFRRILRHIREFACLIEDDGCIVWGIEWYRTARLRMTLFNMDSFMEASEHSTFVWMFHCPSWSDIPECPVMLNCPIGHLGNIKYYFDEKHHRRFPEC
ncbi:unnamed protein product [Camellia sinensis]